MFTVKVAITDAHYNCKNTIKSQVWIFGHRDFAGAMQCLRIGVARSLATHPPSKVGRRNHPKLSASAALTAAAAAREKHLRRRTVSVAGSPPPRTQSDSARKSERGDRRWRKLAAWITQPSGYSLLDCLVRRRRRQIPSEVSAVFSVDFRTEATTHQLREKQEQLSGNGPRLWVFEQSVKFKSKESLNYKGMNMAICLNSESLAQAFTHLHFQTNQVWVELLILSSHNLDNRCAKNARSAMSEQEREDRLKVKVSSPLARSLLLVLQVEVVSGALKQIR